MPVRRSRLSGGQTRLGGRRLFAGVGREGETGQGHPEQAEHDGKNAQRIKNAEPDLAHGSGLLSGQNDVSDGSMCKK